MSLLTQASLITTPTAYRTSKLYSIVPSSGNGDMTVVRATSATNPATRANGSKVVESVGNNVPRLNYDANGSASILLEPQRTNLLVRSEEFDNAIWNKAGATISVNSAISPSGLLVADKLVENTSTDFHAVLINMTVVAGEKYTYSIYVKASERNKFTFNVYDTTFVNSYGANFNIITGTITSTTNQGLGTLLSSSIKNVGNDWYLCSITGALPTFANLTLAFFLNDNSGSTSYNGNGTSGLFIWGAQFEAGSYPTSYIPTTTTALTRNVDTVSKTAISDLIGQTEGVIFIESAALFNDLTQRVVSISDATSANRIGIYYNSTSNQILVYGGANGTPFANAVGYVLTDETQFAKIAVRYRVNDITLWVNGVKRGTDITSQALPINLSRLAFDSGGGGASFYAKVKQLQLYKTYLTDAEMTSLTTL